MLSWSDLVKEVWWWRGLGGLVVGSGWEVGGLSPAHLLQDVMGGEA